jgi:hypothetical protein
LELGELGDFCNSSQVLGPSKIAASKKRKKVIELREKRVNLVLREDIIFENILEKEKKKLTGRFFGRKVSEQLVRL